LASEACASLLKARAIGNPMDDGSGTQLVRTEQLAYLDSHDDLEERQGAGEGLDRLVLELSGGLPAA